MGQFHLPNAPDRRPALRALSPPAEPAPNKRHRKRIAGESAPAGENRVVIRRPVGPDSKLRKTQQKRRGVGFRDPSPTFVHDQDISHLEPPERWYDALLSAYLQEGLTGIGMIFILKSPAR